MSGGEAMDGGIVDPLELASAFAEGRRAVAEARVLERAVWGQRLVRDELPRQLVDARSAAGRASRRQRTSVAALLRDLSGEMGAPELRGALSELAVGLGDPRLSGAAEAEVAKMLLARAHEDDRALEAAWERAGAMTAAFRAMKLIDGHVGEPGWREMVAAELRADGVRSDLPRGLPAALADLAWVMEAEAHEASEHGSAASTLLIPRLLAGQGPEALRASGLTARDLRDTAARLRAWSDQAQTGPIRDRMAANAERIVAAAVVLEQLELGQVTA